jgi:hypothetical protein
MGAVAKPELPVMLHGWSYPWPSGVPAAQSTGGMEISRTMNTDLIVFGIHRDYVVLSGDPLRIKRISGAWGFASDSNPARAGPVTCNERLGGLLKFYHRKAG